MIYLRHWLRRLLRGEGGRRRKTPLHLAPHCERLAVRHLDIGPTDDVARADIAREPDMVRQPDRQRALCNAALGRHKLAPDRIAALAIEGFSGMQGAFR